MSWQNQLKNISVALAVVGGIWMALTVGLGDVFNIITDPASVDPATAASLGGIDFIDRVAVAGVVVTLLGTSGLALVKVDRKNNPPFVNTILEYAPVIIGFVAFSAFSSEVFDTITGNRDWSAFDDIQNSYILFLAASLVSGLTSLLKKN